MVQIEIIEEMDYSGEEPPLKGIFYLIKWNCEMHGDYDLIRKYFDMDGVLIQTEHMGMGDLEFNLIQSAFKRMEAI